jgi:hypothetical protein
MYAAKRKGRNRVELIDERAGASASATATITGTSGSSGSGKDGARRTAAETETIRLS